MTYPNPKSCSKCCKMPKSNFLFLDVMFMVQGYAEMTHPNPKSCSKCCKMPKSNLPFLVVTCLAGGMLKIPHPNLNMNATEKNHLPPCSQSCNLTLQLYCLVLPPSTRGLCLGVGGWGEGTLPGNFRLFGKNVWFTEDRFHKHRCAYSCAKKARIVTSRKS